MPRRVIPIRLLIGLILSAVVMTTSTTKGSERAISHNEGNVAQEDIPKVNQVKLNKVKAAFIVNFMKFTNWPDDAFESEQSPIRVCIIGKSPVGEYLETTLKTAKVHGRSLLQERLEIPLRQQFTSDESFESEMADFAVRLTRCHMIYISQDDTPGVKELLGKTDLQHTLVIANDVKMLAKGAHLVFLIKDGHVAFSASVDNINRTKLKVSSKLLQLAQKTK